MDREQLRGCSQSLLMQEVRRRELSPGFLTQYWGKNQVRQGNTHPTSQSRQFCGGLPTTFPSCGYPLSLVDGAAAALSYAFTRGDDASLHLTFPLPNWSCSLTSMRCSQLLILGDPRFTTLRRSSLLIFWDSQLTSDHLTQARATLRPVRPSGRSPKLHQLCNICIHPSPLAKYVVTRANTKMTYSHTHHVACRYPNVSSNRSSDPSGHLPSPSCGQQPSSAPPSPSPSTCAL